MEVLEAAEEADFLEGASEEADFLEEVDFWGAAFFGGADSVEASEEAEAALVLEEILAIGVSVLARESRRAFVKGKRESERERAIQKKHTQGSDEWGVYRKNSQKARAQRAAQGDSKMQAHRGSACLTRDGALHKMPESGQLKLKQAMPV